MNQAFYNENEPYAAEWLENLSRANLILPGRVETRSIVDLKPRDLEGAAQAHFFAGVGVWSYALRLAGWPDSEEVWTGSCPCQPFSQAGRGKGKADERHLWPAWFKLIKKCRPRVIFGENVSSPDGLGWFDTVHADLERAGYAVAALDICAAGVGAPHIRQRLYFVSVADGERRGRKHAHVLEGKSRQDLAQAARRGAVVGMAYSGGKGLEVVGKQQARRQRQAPERGVTTRELADATSQRGDEGSAHGRRSEDRSRSVQGCSRNGLAVDGASRILGDASIEGGGRDAGAVPRAETQSPEERFNARRVPHELVAPGAVNGAWAQAEWWLCRDGRARPAQPGAFPLSDRAPTRVGPGGTLETQPRVGAIKAYGNAIVPQQAALFIRALGCGFTHSSIEQGSLSSTSKSRRPRRQRAGSGDKRDLRPCIKTERFGVGIRWSRDRATSALG